MPNVAGTLVCDLIAMVRTPDDRVELSMEVSAVQYDSCTEY